MMLPVPFAAPHDAPTVALQVQDTLANCVGIRSVIFAPVTLCGPMFVASMTYVIGSARLTFVTKLLFVIARSACGGPEPIAAPISAADSALLYIFTSSIIPGKIDVPSPWAPMPKSTAPAPIDNGPTIELSSTPFTNMRIVVPSNVAATCIQENPPVGY